LNAFSLSYIPYTYHVNISHYCERSATINSVQFGLFPLCIFNVIYIHFLHVAYSIQKLNCNSACPQRSAGCHLVITKHKRMLQRATVPNSGN
jgi:hypothetical protein